MSEQVKPSELDKQIALELTVAAVHGAWAKHGGIPKSLGADVAAMYHAVLEGVANPKAGKPGG